MNHKPLISLNYFQIGLSKAPDHLKKEIGVLVKRFRGATRTRNMLCHAEYSVNEDTFQLESLDTFDFTHDERVFVIRTKKADRALLNEIQQSDNSLSEINHEAWALIEHLERELEVQHLKLRKPPPGYPRNPRLPLLDKE